MSLKKLLIIFISFMLVPKAYSQRQFFTSKNEIYKDSSLFFFVSELQKIVLQKDTKELLKLIDPQIKNGFEGENGISNFKKDWNLESPKSQIWNCLTSLIKIGGVFTSFQMQGKNDFVFPYTFETEINSLPKNVDEMGIGFIIANEVNLREKPDINSRPIAKLSFEIVDTNYDKAVKSQNNYYEPYDWYFISTLDKKYSGYVNSRYYQSLIGWRLYLSKIKGKWMITGLLGGD